MTAGKVFAMSLEDLTKRVTTLEAQASVNHQTAAAALALAVGADRDVADFRAELRGHVRVLGALRETQLEQGQVLAQHGQILAQHGEALAQHGEALAQHGEVLAQHGEALDQLSAAVGQIREQHGAKLDDIVGLLNHLVDRDHGQG
jgi:hypothetical protein